MRATYRTLLLSALVPVLPLVAQGNGRPTPPPPPPPPEWPSSLPTQRVTYRTLSETNYEMERIAAEHPSTVRRFELPHRSLLGQRIWGLEVTHDVNQSSGKPVFLMTGVHHAREWPTNELTMEFVHDLLQSDGKDPHITSLLDRVRLIVVPIVNVDGFDMSRTLIHENQRKSCRVELGKVPTWAECAAPKNAGAGVDLNRNYGAFWGGSGASIGVSGGSSRGEAPFSEPEIQNMRDLMWSNQITVALSNHTPDARVLRVPSATEEPTPADVVPYDSLAQLLGKDLNWPAGGWTAIYYAASGTMEETAYYGSGTLAFTFENTPGQRSFHPPYNFVIDQYSGTGAYPGSSARAGFLRLMDAAADTTLHSVLHISAPSGAKLTLQKSFSMETSPIVQGDSGVAPLPARTFPVTLTSSLTVPAKATRVTWHVNPSVRPSQHAQEWIKEEWSLTCEVGQRRKTITVMVKRGDSVTIDLKRCDG